MRGSLAGRVAIVTGSSEGIGRASVRALLGAEAAVVGCSRSAIAKTDMPQGEYHHRRTDVEDPSQIEELVDWTLSRFGRLDILVNNAGQHPPSEPIDAISIEDFDWLMRLNARSVFIACRKALPALRATHGSIINLGSAVGLNGQEGAAAYCATKGAISALTKALAIDEAPHGVRVNAVCPGAILTSSAMALHSEERRQIMESWSWMNRWGTPEEVASLILFLASDESSFITGQDLLIGGGSDLGYGFKGREYFRSMGS